MEKFWRFSSILKNWKTGLLLLLIFTASRFYLVLQANVTGSYQKVSFIFIAMIIFPFLFLTGNGRKQIGIKKGLSLKGIVVSIGIGVLAAIVIYFAMSGFEESHQAYYYVSKTYKDLPSPLGENRFVFFMIFSGMSMLFSPLGEEFFYRGLVHEHFKSSFSETTASVVDSLAFALVHLAHFGIVYSAAAGWEFLLFPSIVWVVLLFFTCLGFNYARKVNGSIWGAVIAHAIFNLTMNYFIFYRILP